MPSSAFFELHRWRVSLAFASLVVGQLFFSPLQAQQAGRGVLEQRRQEERVEAIRQREERAVDVRREQMQTLPLERLPDDETPCFKIDHVAFKGSDPRFSWLGAAVAGPDGSDPVLGRCLGGKRLGIVLRRLQNRLIQEGYITTQVSLADQDLKSGTLEITVTPGRIGRIEAVPPDASRIRLKSNVPARPGDILNLRDIEQGLENLRGLPSADADVRISPTQTPGESDILVEYRQSFPLRLTLTADDGGSKSTGKYQGGLTLAYDNPLGLSDLIYLSLNRDLDQRGADGARSGVFHYAVPFGYWNASVTYDRNRHYQKIVGLTQDYTYSGKSENISLRLGRVVFRDGRSKTTLAGGAFQKRSSNYIDDTEVEVQRRRTAGWFAEAHHQYFTEAGGLFNVSLDYRRGTGALGAISAPEEDFKEGTSRFQLLSLGLNYNLPFTLGQRHWIYRLNGRAQWNGSQLAPPERFIIGGRYTVRGFDGESVLAAERGVLIRNELATGLAQGMEIYLGLDYGKVSGPTARLLIGQQLAGSVVGVRGTYRAFHYDLFVGAPLDKPKGFRTASTTAGFNISMNF